MTCRRTMAALAAAVLAGAFAPVVPQMSGKCNNTDMKECLKDPGGWRDVRIMPEDDIKQMQTMLRAARWGNQFDEDDEVWQSFCKDVRQAATFLFSVSDSVHAYDYLAKGRDGRGRDWVGAHGKFTSDSLMLRHALILDNGLGNTDQLVTAVHESAHHVGYGHGASPNAQDAEKCVERMKHKEPRNRNAPTPPGPGGTNETWGFGDDGGGWTKFSCTKSEVRGDMTVRLTLRVPSGWEGRVVFDGGDGHATISFWGHDDDDDGEMTFEVLVRGAFLGWVNNCTFA